MLWTEETTKALGDTLVGAQQEIHTFLSLPLAQRHTRVERFLLEIGLSPAQSSSRNLMEQPWTLTPDELRRRCSARWQLALPRFHRSWWAKAHEAFL